MSSSTVENIEARDDEKQEHDPAASSVSKKKKNKKKKKKKKKAGISAVVVNAERKSAGEGRGLGMFASKELKPGDIITQARPALSVIYNQASLQVCGFCFASAATNNAVPSC